MPKQPEHRSRGAKWDGWLLLGMALSIGLGLVTALLPFTNAQLMGALIGMTGAVLTLQIDNALRLERRFDAEDDRLALLKAVERAPEMLPDLTALAQSTARAMEYDSYPEFATIARAQLGSARALASRLGTGEFLTGDGDTTYMEMRLLGSRTSVQATSFTSDVAWWRSPNGAKYLHVHYALHSRGVQIERVFIIDREGDDIRQVMHAQYEAGIDVFYADQRLLPHDLCRNIAIYDGKYLVEDQVNAAGRVTGYLHSVNATTVTQARESFVRLRTVSTRYDGDQTTRLLGGKDVPDS